MDATTLPNGKLPATFYSFQIHLLHFTMRFSSVIAPLFAICSALGVAFASPVLDARQEAARFGGVYATPSTVKPGQVRLKILLPLKADE